MAHTYFLGAGASAADGLPITSQLNFGVAHYLSGEGRDSALMEFYRSSFAVDADLIRNEARIWASFLRTGKEIKARTKMPGLVETLSMLDVCVVDNRSLGPGHRSGGTDPIELTNAALRRARSELVDALRLTIVRAIATVSRNAHHTRALLKRMNKKDYIVTTNWDCLPEFELGKTQRRRDGRWLKHRNMRFDAGAPRG